MLSIYLITSILSIKILIISGFIQNYIEEYKKNDVSSHVIEGWCSMKQAKFENLNILYRIPRWIDYPDRFSSANYYISAKMNTGLSLSIRQNYKKVNTSNGEIWYKTENNQKALYDLLLTLRYGAKYYIDINQGSSSHILKYICANGESNYYLCHDFQTYVTTYAHNYSNLLVVRIMVSNSGIRFYEIYQDNSDFYAIERSTTYTNFNRLNNSNTFNANINLIFQMLDVRMNWSDLITMNDPYYKTIRHNIISVMRDCHNQSTSSMRSQTNNAFMKTYILSDDDLCNVISNNGIYNLIFINRPQSPINLTDLKMYRPIDTNNININLIPNFTITYNPIECIHEMILFDTKSIDLMKHNDRELEYDIHYQIETNGTNENDTIKITYLYWASIESIEMNATEVSYNQVNNDARMKYIMKTDSVLQWYTMFLVKFRYHHGPNHDNSECPSNIKFYITMVGKNVVKKVLKKCHK